MGKEKTRQMPQWICINVEIILLIPNLLSVYPHRIVLYSGWVPEEQKTDWLEMKALLSALDSFL